MQNYYVIAVKLKRSILYIIFILVALPAISQKGVKVPSYFGLQVRPIFPTRFIGSPLTELSKNGFQTRVEQKMGYSFGGTVRAGITEFIAFETGLNFAQRNFQIDFAMPDSNSFGSDNLSFVEYNIPINGLIYIKLTDNIYMNSSLGAALTYKPSDVFVSNSPGGLHQYLHYGVTRSKIGLDLNANIGFEYRTRKKGFFYIGGSARVPTAPLFDILASYNYQGFNIQTEAPINGSFLALDFKYIFPNIENRGPQFQNGPIE